MSEMIATHAMVFLKVADDRLDGGPPFELALDLRRDAALLAGGVDLETCDRAGRCGRAAPINETRSRRSRRERSVSASCKPASCGSCGASLHVPRANLIPPPPELSVATWVHPLPSFLPRSVSRWRG